MVNIFVLHLSSHHLSTPTMYYFSSVENIVEFLQKAEYSRYPTQTVVHTQIDSNERQPFYINGHGTPCNTFNIDKYGTMIPMNKHNR